MKTKPILSMILLSSLLALLILTACGGAVRTGLSDEASQQYEEAYGLIGCYVTPAMAFSDPSQIPAGQWLNWYECFLLNDHEDPTPYLTAAGQGFKLDAEHIRSVLKERLGLDPSLSELTGYDPASRTVAVTEFGGKSRGDIRCDAAERLNDGAVRLTFGLYDSESENAEPLLSYQLTVLTTGESYQVQALKFL